MPNQRNSPIAKAVKNSLEHLHLSAMLTTIVVTCIIGFLFQYLTIQTNSATQDAVARYMDVRLNTIEAKIDAQQKKLDALSMQAQASATMPLPSSEPVKK